MEKKILKTLEYDKILAILSEFAVSQISKAEVLKTQPVYNIDEAKALLSLTQEASITKDKYRISPIFEFDDVSEILEKARIAATLQTNELLKIARLARSARIAKTEIQKTGEDIVGLKNIVSSVFVNSDLEKSIGDCIAGENEIKDTASEKLFSLRKKIKNSDAKLKEKLHSYTRSGEVSKYLQDNLITVRNGRFVLPVKSECRSSVPGLIHDQSSSGATVFIEPFAIVDLNNEIRTLKIEEAHEIERILTILTQMVNNSESSLRICQEICIMLDIIYAKSAFSAALNCTCPALNDKGRMNLKNARHPLIDKNKVVPVDIQFGQNNRMLLITGPNTGGKTVCLKIVGLFCLMAYSGLKIPCDDGSEIAVFDNIFCDIGDEQSITSSLSTFSSHMVNIIDITNNITGKSLVLFDELGGGTDPDEGAALAIGIIKYLELMSVSGILTTHYSALKEYALTSKNILNGCMQFDDETLKPTYKLILGIPGISNALKIASTLGLNDYIIDAAYQSLDNDKIQFELVLQNAEKAKSEAIKERDLTNAIRLDLEKERNAIIKERTLVKEKLEKINLNATLETRRIVGRNIGEAEDLILQMKELLKQADEKSLLEAHRLKHKLEDIQYVVSKSDSTNNYKKLDVKSLKIGDRVIIKSLGSNAQVLSLPNHKNELEVLSGNAKIRLKVNELAAMQNADAKASSSKHSESAVADLIPPSTEEIRLLGMTVAEALEVLDVSIMSGIGRNLTIKIIHGKGTGALSRGIHSYLKNEPNVKSFRFGGYYEGGTGVTFAELK